MAPRWAARSANYWCIESDVLLGRRTPGHDRRSDTGKAARAAYSWMESKELYGWKGWRRYVYSCVVLKNNLTY
jgi:hypothetical protein